MVIVLEKEPPPPYRPSSVRNTASSSTATARWLALPQHLILNIVYHTLPSPRPADDQLSPDELEKEMAMRTTRTLHWVARYLRLVNKAFYLASMHLLRSTYLPTYLSLIKYPYTSDPFPTTTVTPSSSQSGPSITTSHNETHILDSFLLLSLQESVSVDDTCLHTHRPDSFRDVFEFMQPKARLGDLVRLYGVAAGLVYERGGAVSRVNGGRRHPRAINSTALSVSFSPRRVGLILTTTVEVQQSTQQRSRTYTYSASSSSLTSMISSLSGSSTETQRQSERPTNVRQTKRTIVEVSRDRNDTLESLASKLVRELKVWMNST